MAKVSREKIDANGNSHEELPESETLATRYGQRHTVRAKPDGTLYNPKNRDHRGGLTRKDTRRGRFTFDFTRCNRSCFDLYVNFLKTRNIAFLNQAQRELQNA